MACNLSIPKIIYFAQNKRYLKTKCLKCKVTVKFRVVSNGKNINLANNHHVANIQSKLGI